MRVTFIKENGENISMCNLEIIPRIGEKVFLKFLDNNIKLIYTVNMVSHDYKENTIYITVEI